MSFGESIRGLFQAKARETRSSTAHMNTEGKIFLKDKTDKFGNAVKDITKTTNYAGKK